MTQPVFAVISPRSAFLEELRENLAEVGRTILCDDLLEAPRLLRPDPPDIVVADLVRFDRDRSPNDDFIQSLRQAVPATKLFAVVHDLCPETIARQAKQASVVLLSQNLSMTDVAQRLITAVRHSAGSSRGNSPTELTANVSVGNASGHMRPLNHRDENENRVGKVSIDQSSDQPGNTHVLAGLTRQFETLSPKLQEMLSELQIAARHDVTVLLIGETGSGKTFLSKLIHEVSPRRDEPFLTVACGALPSDLIESELFGHVKGAFTSAHADKEGKFVAAHGGTILLDEIDVLGPEQQVKLLRVIETGEFEPVGSNQTLQCAARLVVASNLDLKPLVEEGKFRPDLYYRLSMLKFQLPPLRERPADIESLARKFVEQLATRHGVAISRIERGFVEALSLYPWPGNVRELENVVRRAVIYCQDGVLAASHLPHHILSGDAGPTNDPSVRLGPNMSRPMPEVDTEPPTLEKQVAASEQEVIEQTLFRNNFSRTNSAKELGISRVTLYNKMKKYGILQNN
ncbi:sigma-54 interaction domain-containing protein [Stratiformator vulcanicus]|nr:sigma-54 dependent transcriptional regulator [Stratiformator vulcanicus]